MYALAVTLACAACSSGSSGTGGSAGSTGGSGTTSDTGAAGGAPTHVVVNEICAKGADWVELLNPTDGELDLSGLGLCDDVDPSAGSACDLATALRFPSGTKLAAGAYLLIVGDQDVSAGVGPYATCLADGGPSSCYYVSWKVSASNGETIHLVDADGQAVDEARYPVDAVPSGQTWGRLPDGRGGFSANAPTPGKANAAAE
jgi:hypothetical protein